MNELKFAIVVLGTIVFKTIIILCTQDVSLSMYIYLANHFTQQECLKLTAYLYADSLGPIAVKELEQELPLDEPCLSLLMTWNISAGREKNFLTITDSLRKIHHEKLAEWLSDAVFTQLTMELKSCFIQSTTTPQANTTTIRNKLQKIKIQPKLKFESCSSEKTFFFLLFDTFTMYIILMTITTLVFYALTLLVRIGKESKNILTTRKREYKTLELGSLLQDLDPEDEILDPFF